MNAPTPHAAAMDPSTETSADQASAPERAGSGGRLRLIAILAVVAGAIALARQLPLEEWMAALTERVESMGALGPLVYGLFYVVAALAFVPGSAITIAAGAIFGLGTGTVVVSLASTTAAALAFPLARTVLRSKVDALAGRSESFRAIDDAIADGGWKIVGLLRLSPVVPFSALNYLIGLTRVAYVPAVLVSWIAMLPGTLLYVYFGAIGRDVAAGAEKTPLEWGLLGLGLVATLVVTVVLTRTARARMRATTSVEA